MRLKFLAISIVSLRSWKMKGIIPCFMILSVKWSIMRFYSLWTSWSKWRSLRGLMWKDSSSLILIFSKKTWKLFWYSLLRSFEKISYMRNRYRILLIKLFSKIWLEVVNRLKKRLKMKMFSRVTHPGISSTVMKKKSCQQI